MIDFKTLTRSISRQFHSFPSTSRQPNSRSSSYHPIQSKDLSRSLTPKIFQDPWPTTHFPSSSKPRISKQNRLEDLISQRLQSFAQLDDRTSIVQTFNDLGFFKPPSSLNPHSSNQSKINQTWKFEIKSLVNRFVKQVLETLTSNQSNDFNPTFITLRSMVSDCLTHPSKVIDLQAIDRWIVSNFIPWASNQYQPISVQESLEGSEIKTLNSHIQLTLQALFKSLSSLTDIRQPHDQYPDARRYKRQIHLHVGPTNSGKTHAGLRALHGAHTGVYAGPLRLLAHEVFTRLNQGQIASDLPPRACNLITGEEQRTVDVRAGLTSCTVEMLSPHQFYEVVVIDEIQMIGDRSRGDAWTHALLATQAKELHLCGEESVVGLIKSLSEACGDQFILHRYQRLTPLKVSEKSLENDLSQVERGDCVVTFSRNNIYAIKKYIQQHTNLRVGMAYGGLPPEVREREARMFNLGSEIEGEGGYDVLVGSDAIGMGLNLKIKRVIFEALHKFDGQTQVPLSTSQIKQIGGRAGRYGVISPPSNLEPHPPSTSDPSHPNTQSIGEVLTLQESEMPLLRDCMSAPFHPIQQAVIKAPFKTLEGLSRLLPSGTRFSSLLALRQTLSITSSMYLIGDETNSIRISNLLESIPQLSLTELDLFSSSPVSSRNPIAMDSLQTWALDHSKRLEVDLHAWLRHQRLEHAISSIKNLLRPPHHHHSNSNSDSNKTRTQDRLESQTLLRLESLHKCLVLYLWLGFRLPETFTSMALCSEWKTKSEDALAFGLNAMGHRRTTLDEAQLKNSDLLETTIITGVDPLNSTSTELRC